MVLFRKMRDGFEHAVVHHLHGVDYVRKTSARSSGEDAGVGTTAETQHRAPCALENERRIGVRGAISDYSHMPADRQTARRSGRRFSGSIVEQASAHQQRAFGEQLEQVAWRQCQRQIMGSQGLVSEALAARDAERRALREDVEAFKRRGVGMGSECIAGHTVINVNGPSRFADQTVTPSPMNRVQSSPSPFVSAQAVAEQWEGGSDGVVQRSKDICSSFVNYGNCILGE
ncbi:hypothetical protein N9L68_00660 [bacterium]|nr:hypothetical protein [bacterium]